MKQLFVNCSNHPSARWSLRQKEAARRYGEIVDIKFPQVDPKLDGEQISKLADRVCEEILRYNPAAVMCQGEHTLTYCIVEKLRGKGIKVVAACSERRAEEIGQPDGTVEKRSIFEFIGFREYGE